MQVAYYRAEVERKGDEVIVHMSDATACALADFLVGPREVDLEYGFEMVDSETPTEWEELAAELRGVRS